MCFRIELVNFSLLPQSKSQDVLAIQVTKVVTLYFMARTLVL